MNFIKPTSLPFSLAVLVLSLSCKADSFQFIGKAFDLNSGALLYQEHHRVTLNQYNQYEQTQVTYTDKKGNVFATKQLDFSDALLVPRVRFVDTRSDVTLKIEHEDRDIKVVYQDSRDSLKANIKYRQKMVVDAGFDQLLLEQWEQVLNGNTIEFEFLAPTRGELIDFSLIPIAQTDKDIEFDLQPSNFLIRLLVDPIKLTYDKKHKRILRYEGLTNIEDESKDGDYFVAKIEYEYTDH
ncbi:MAG: hypothetical protein HWE18_07560 [Gammaproteobacteria bacterium]|nr:hypothetical protein [Gammaproteobacteria bacterium]